MLHFNEGACHVLAADTRSTFSDVDKAYLSSLRMAATIVETIESAGLPVSQTQKVYRRMSDGIAQLVQGRGELVSVVGQLLVLRSQSNCAETAFGCPIPLTGQASSEGEPQATVAA